MFDDNSDTQFTYDDLSHQISDINGSTRHGLNQAINRGISPDSILDAIRNPLQIVERPDGSKQYRGANATVVLRPDGYVITVWPR